MDAQEENGGSMFDQSEMNGPLLQMPRFEGLLSPEVFDRLGGVSIAAFSMFMGCESQPAVFQSSLPFVQLAAQIRPQQFRHRAHPIEDLVGAIELVDRQPYIVQRDKRVFEQPPVDHYCDELPVGAL